MNMKVSTNYGTVTIKKANQGEPYQLYKKVFKSKKEKILIGELSDIIKKYYPNYSDKEIKSLYNDLEKSGCTYASIANVIVEQLGDNDDLFKEIFGYSLYDGEGNINYNKLSVDIFACISKMVELRVHMYESYEFDNYLTAAKEILGKDFKDEKEAILELFGNKDVNLIADGISLDNKLKFRSKGCINKSYVGTYEQIAKELFGLDAPNLTKTALESMLHQNNYTFDFYYEDIPSKLSGLGDKSKNLKKWINKFFEINGIKLDLEVETINSYSVSYEDFVDIIVDKQNNGYSIEVSAPLNRELWMTDGKEWERPNSNKAGHQMNFEGFDKDGNILVCSWGKTYMFPKEFYERLEFIGFKINAQDKNIEKGGKSK